MFFESVTVILPFLFFITFSNAKFESKSTTSGNCDNFLFAGYVLTTLPVGFFLGLEGNTGRYTVPSGKETKPSKRTVAFGNSDFKVLRI